KKIFAFTPCCRAAGIGSIEGSAQGRWPVAPSFTQSVEPGTGTSCTFSPAFPYQPLFIAMANGAAADVIVRAQNPTLTTVSAACAENAVPRRIAAVNVVFIARLSATPPTPLSGTDPRTARAAGWPPARR